MALANQQMVLANQRMALNLLSAMKPKFKAGLLEQGTATFCRAYALEPRLCLDHLLVMPTGFVRHVVSTLEGWCTQEGHVISDKKFQLLQIPLTWEQVCDFILSQHFAPRSYQAFSVKVRYQMQKKHYANLVGTCTKALKIFAAKQGKCHAFWIPRGLAFLVQEESTRAVQDYLSAYEENPAACQAFITKQQNDHVDAILKALYDTLDELDRKAKGAKSVDLTVSTKLLGLIITLEKDPVACEVCARRMIKERNFKEASKALSLALQHMTEKSVTADNLPLLFSRAECYLALDEIDKALGDYMAATSLGVEPTSAILRALPLHQQNTLVTRAEHVLNDTLARCQQNTALGKRHLNQAAVFFKLLHLMNEKNVAALYSAAECYKLLGSFPEAIQLFTRILSLEPESADAHCDRAACYLESGDMQSALSDYDTALTLHPESVQGFCGRAWFWVRRGEPGNAVTDLAAASRLSTTLSAFWIQTLNEKEQVDMRAKLKDHLAGAVKSKSVAKLGEDALAAADMLIRTWSSDVACHLLYADILVDLKKMDEAEASLVKLLQNAPDELTAIVHLTRLLIKQGKVETALESLATAAKTHGEQKLKAALLKLEEDQRGQISREAHKRGVQRVEDKNPDVPKSEMLFTVAVSAAPCQADAWESYFWRSRVRWLLRNLRSALNDCTSAMALKEDSAEMWCWRGFLLLHTKNTKQAYLDLVRALLADNDTLERFITSRHRDETKRLIDALEDCVQRLFRLYSETEKEAEADLNIITLMCHLLVKLDGTSYTHHSNLADAFICGKDFKRAAEALSEAERISPESLSILIRGCHMQMLLGNVNEGIRKLCGIAKLQPKEVKFTMKLFNTEQKQLIASKSFIHAGACADDRAVLCYTVCIEASTGNAPDALRMRSQCLKRLKCYECAIEDVSAVINMGTSQVGDLCTRASLYLLSQKSKAACSDYIAALEIDKKAAQRIISQCPDRKDGVCQEFLNAAMEEIQARNLAGGLKLCKYGLRIDQNNAELKKVKSQLEKPNKKCKIQ